MKEGQFERVATKLRRHRRTGRASSCSSQAYEVACLMSLGRRRTTPMMTILVGVLTTKSTGLGPCADGAKSLPTGCHYLTRPWR